MQDLVIISDPGVDDAVALCLLQKMLPNIPKLLISTFGNAPENITGQNAKDIANFLGKSWYFQHGPELPVNGNVEHSWPTYFHGSDGFWGVRPPKKSQSSQALIPNFSYSTVISLGPLTAAQSILESHRVDRLVLMGGAFQEKGNETPYAECNIAFDADAAHALFENFGKTNVYLVPLDATRRVFWSHEKALSIPERDATGIWLKQLLLAWFDNYDHEKEKDFNLHDPLAVFLAVHPDKINWERQAVEVVTRGAQRGRTNVLSLNSKCNIALDIRNPSQISEQIFDLLFHQNV